MSALGLVTSTALAPAEIAARSRRELDRPLAHDAELTIARASDDAVLAGAFQRGAEVDTSYALFRRGSGGAAARVGPGTLWVSLALARPEALVLCPPDKLVNRYVRPLLRALTALGATASWFGRDWISVAHRPAALVGFAHDAASGRAQVEALVALSTPFALEPRATFLGKEPATIDELTGKAADPDRVARSIAEAYAMAFARALEPRAAPLVALDEPDLRADPPWTATVTEAIGIVGAGRDAGGAMRLGGEFMASRDAVAALEARLAAMKRAPTSSEARNAPVLPARAPSEDEIARAVDETLGAPGAVVEGVRSRASIVGVIARAFGG